MAKVKVSDLDGISLDYMVAVLEGRDSTYLVYFTSQWHLNKSLRYSTNRDKGGAIIERELIATYPMPGKSGGAWRAEQAGMYLQAGDTPLVAGMRCYVSSKLGYTVDVPASIMKAWKG